jgi:hypothetical protein
MPEIYQPVENFSTEATNNQDSSSWYVDSDQTVLVKGVITKFDGISVTVTLPLSSDNIDSGFLWNNSGILNLKA